MIELIPLRNGGAAIIDAADRNMVCRWPWRTNNWGYAVATIWVRGEDRQITIAMHRVIMGASPGQLVDHIDGNKLNNARSNLRVCDRAHNQRNKAGHSAQSRYKGVRPRYGGKWEARICVNYESEYLGLFDSEESAARAYDAAAVIKHGEYARLNLGAS